MVKCPDDRQPKNNRCPGDRPFLQTMSDGKTKCCYKYTKDKNYKSAATRNLLRGRLRKIRVMEKQMAQMSQETDQLKKSYESKLRAYKRHVKNVDSQKVDTQIEKLRKCNERCKSKIEAIRKEQGDQEDKLQRCQTEYQNMVDRYKKELSDFKQYVSSMAKPMMQQLKDNQDKLLSITQKYNDCQQEKLLVQYMLQVAESGRMYEADNSVECQRILQQKHKELEMLRQQYDEVQHRITSYNPRPVQPDLSTKALVITDDNETRRLMEVLRNTQDMLAVIQAERDQLETQKNELEKQIQDMHTDEEYMQLVRERDELIKTNTEAVDNLRAKNMALVELAEKLELRDEEKYNQLVSQHVQLQQQYDGINDQYNDMRDRMASLQKSYDQLVVDRKQLYELLKVENPDTESISDLVTKINELHQTIEQLSNSNVTLHRKLEDTAQDFLDYRQSVDGMYTDQISELKDQITRLESNISERENTIKDLQREIRESNKDDTIDGLRHELSEYQKTVKMLHQTIRTLETTKAVSVNDEKYNELLEQKNQLQSRILVLENFLMQTDDIVSLLETRYPEISIDDQTVWLATATDLLRKDLRDLQYTTEQMEYQYNVLQTTVNSLIRRISTIEDMEGLQHLKQLIKNSTSSVDKHKLGVDHDISQDKRVVDPVELSYRLTYDPMDFDDTMDQPDVKTMDIDMKLHAMNILERLSLGPGNLILMKDAIDKSYTLQDLLDNLRQVLNLTKVRNPSSIIPPDTGLERAITDTVTAIENI